MKTPKLLHETKTHVRKFLFGALNKEFLIFLFFLLVSGSYWLLLALNETMEREVCVPVRLVDVPKNVIVTTDIQDTIRVTVRDKGYTVGAYFWTGKLSPIEVSFADYAKANGMGQVSSAELLKMVRQELYSSTKIVQVKPDRLDFYYNYGQKRRMPVRLYGRILPGQSYYLARTVFRPDSVDVYASREALDTIKCVYTEWQDIRNVTDTIHRKVELRRIKGAKCVPTSIRMSVFPDVLTEETVEVPVVAVNMPEGKVLRTFPSRVTVRFVVGASMFRMVNTSKFYVVADYNELMEHPSDKCNLSIRTVPYGVRKARLVTPQVDYLIEQQNDNEDSNNRRNR